MSEELMHSMKMNLNQRPTLEMNSAAKPYQSSAEKPYLTLRLPEDLSEHSGDQSSTYWSHDLRISDNSHSDSNPGQRKKGGCKSVSLNVTVNGRVFSIPAKCDVRKSFSNRSFAQYYDRSAYAIIPLDSNGLYLTVREAVKGRDGKYFVAMEKSRCSIDQRPSNSRHPLLAFASESVYCVVVHSTKNDANSQALPKFDCRLEAKCLFQQGSASVITRHTPSSESKAVVAAREVKVKVEPVEPRPQPTVARTSFVPVHEPRMDYYSPAHYGMSHMQAHAVPVTHHNGFTYAPMLHHYHPAPHVHEPFTFSSTSHTVHEAPIMKVQQPVTVKVESTERDHSVLGKRSRQPDTDSWFESKHTCAENSLPSHFFPLTIEQDAPVGLHKVESIESMADLFDHESGSSSPSSPFDSDDCFSPSSPFSDSFSDAADLSPTVEYDSFFPQHVESGLLASPLYMPPSSPFSHPFSSNWEPFNLSEFSLQ